MAKQTKRGKAKVRGVSLSSQAAVREAVGGESRRDPATGFAIPHVRGMRPAISNDPVDLESSRFTSAGTAFPSSRRVSDAALEAAQRRMRGTFDHEPEPLDDDNDGELDESEGESEEAPPMSAAMLRKAAMFAAPEPAVQGRAFTLPIKTAPPPAPAAQRDGLSLAPVTIEDVDQLWDWLRQDADRGASFFLQPPANSVALHRIIGGLVMNEGGPAASGVVRAILYRQPTTPPVHLGFVMLAPVLLAEGIAVLHVYLRQDVRPRLLDVSLDLMDEISALVPGLQLAVYGSEPQWEKVLAPLGFTKHTMFVR